jgi:thioredoxin 1
MARLLREWVRRKSAVEKMNSNPDKAPIGKVGQGNFESEVLRSPQPVLVAFGASWSRPCHIIESVLDEVAATCAGSVKVVKVNADDNPDLSLWYEIESVPTLLCFVGGEVRARVVGTASKEAILAKLQSAFCGAEARVPPTETNHNHEHDHS